MDVRQLPVTAEAVTTQAERYLEALQREEGTAWTYQEKVLGELAEWLWEGPAATWEAVRDQLPEHRWVHFSCHGDQNLADPSRGGIVLYDRILTIAEVSEGRYRGDFAFLSACKTATGSVALPDEAITLAAADVAEVVYADLTSGGAFEPDRSASALHRAVRGLRGIGRPLSHWAPFIHTGP